ncbi:TPA: hypothetical protein EYP13_00375, partial [Candidatus Micrarchaeota archaeon]|nr:hypothetical protein [Candidatus Micrarchaeota archaeon]
MASGEEPLERYPGSVMLSYSKDGEFPVSYEIGYGTEDPHGKVAEWFKRTLKAKGWELTSQSGSSDTIHLVFRKDDDTVNIWTGTQPGAAYTVIDVSYTKRSLPDRDLVKGTDPLPRYPGAVMVGYNESSMNIQGFGSSAVKAVYLAPDKIDKVREWYLEMLRARFPNIYHDEGSIEAGSQEGRTI